MYVERLKFSLKRFFVKFIISSYLIEVGVNVIYCKTCKKESEGNFIESYNRLSVLKEDKDK